MIIPPMKILKFYSAASVVVLFLSIVQRIIWLTHANDTTHSIGLCLTVFNSFWWIATIIASIKFKQTGLSAVMPLAWLTCGILSFCTAPFLVALMIPVPCSTWLLVQDVSQGNKENVKLYDIHDLGTVMGGER
jgi:hypothetical protein